MRIFILIERRFYVRDGVLQQTGDTITSFFSYDAAVELREDIIKMDVIGTGCTECYDDFLNQVTLTRPNGSKVELEIQESTVK